MNANVSMPDIGGIVLMCAWVAPQVTNGLEAAYGFARGSPAVELTVARVGDIANALLSVRSNGAVPLCRQRGMTCRANCVQVAVYRGGKRNSKEDVMIGSIQLPLKSLLDGKEVRWRCVLCLKGVGGLLFVLSFNTRVVDF